MNKKLYIRITIASIAGLLLGLLYGWYFFAPQKEQKGDEKTLDIMYEMHHMTYKEMIMSKLINDMEGKFNENEKNELKVRVQEIDYQFTEKEADARLKKIPNTKDYEKIKADISKASDLKELTDVRDKLTQLLFSDEVVGSRKKFATVMMMRAVIGYKNAYLIQKIFEAKKKDFLKQS